MKDPFYFHTKNEGSYILNPNIIIQHVRHFFFLTCLKPDDHTFILQVLYTEEFAMLHRIIHYSVNEVAYNEGLIGWDVGFVISREDCINCIKILLNLLIK